MKWTLDGVRELARDRAAVGNGAYLSNYLNGAQILIDMWRRFPRELPALAAIEHRLGDSMWVEHFDGDRPHAR
jgi:hypothetical protein